MAKAVLHVEKGGNNFQLILFLDQSLCQYPQTVGFLRVELQDIFELTTQQAKSINIRKMPDGEVFDDVKPGMKFTTELHRAVEFSKGVSTCCFDFLLLEFIVFSRLKVFNSKAKQGLSSSH